MWTCAWRAAADALGLGEVGDLSDVLAEQSDQ